MLQLIKNQIKFKPQLNDQIWFYCSLKNSYSQKKSQYLHIAKLSSKQIRFQFAHKHLTFVTLMSSDSLIVSQCQLWNVNIFLLFMMVLIHLCCNLITLWWVVNTFHIMFHNHHLSVKIINNFQMRLNKSSNHRLKISVITRKTFLWHIEGCMSRNMQHNELLLLRRENINENF